MNKILERLKSSKFLAMVFGVLGVLWSWLILNAVSPDMAIGSIAALISVWMKSQGEVDSAKMTAVGEAVAGSGTLSPTALAKGKEDIGLTPSKPAE